MYSIRRLLLGKPIATRDQESALLNKIVALPVFCSDAISSVAYGGQQILLALCLAGFWQQTYAQIYHQHVMTITWAIIAVLVVVALSYWQTIQANPLGGGSYIVTKNNLGPKVGLVAASALLIDYVLCVSVSVASGLQNLRDVPLLAFMHIGDHMVIYCLAAILFMTFLNIRGLRDPGVLFAIPVYTFIILCYVMIVLGLFGHHWGHQFHLEYANQTVPSGVGIHGTIEVAALAVLLRAFATGCSALTGVEAVADGVPAFKEPKSHNAQIVLVWMAIILGTIFLGVSLLAVKFHIVYWESNGISASAVIDQISGTVFGKVTGMPWAYTLTQLATALILLVAAQTSFADFPRVCSFLARDSYAPRQLANVGDRLAFDNGIVVLGLLSAFFIVLKRGSVDMLIPFFTIGVFVAFTLSQTSMVVHWFRQKGAGWHFKAFANGIGAIATSLVFLDIVTEKFIDGAWFVVVLVCILLFLFHKIHGHYENVRKQLMITHYEPPKRLHNKVVILVQGLHAGTLRFLEYARSLSKDCEALYIEIEPQWTKSVEDEWKKYVPDVPLVVVRSPYRSLVRPIMHYLDKLHKQDPDQIVTVIVGEFVSEKWWHGLLHGNTGLILKFAFLARRDVVVTNVRYWLCDNPGQDPCPEIPDHEAENSDSIPD
jgi:amino acid transporter